MSGRRISATAIRAMKSGEAPRKIVCVTAYDFPTARALDQAGVDIPFLQVLLHPARELELR